MNVCFAGCSFTYGEGFSEEERYNVYDRILEKELSWNRTNVAQPGNSNHNIFLSSANAIMSKQYDIVFVQWSGLNRMWLYPGPDTTFDTHRVNTDYTYRDIFISQRERKKFVETLLILNHDYKNILDLVDYCNVLESLGTVNNTKVYFINGIVPWQDDLVNLSDYTNMSQLLSLYTKEILDFENRNDDEIKQFVSVLQNKLLTLNLGLWVNPFDSMSGRNTDVAPAGHHPGVKSHRIMANQVIDFLEGKL